jgi:site-specific DNA-methyltransferase (adenine-specific)
MMKSLESWPCHLVRHDYNEVGAPLPALPRKADLVFADPPYNLGVPYKDDPTKDRMKPEAYREFTARAITQLASLARPGATFWWMTTEQHADWTGQMLTDLVGPRLERIVWYETFAQYQGDRGLTRDYRFIFCHLVRPAGEDVKDWRDLLTWNPDAIRVPSARQTLYNDKRANGKGRVPGTTWHFNDAKTLDDIARDIITSMPHQITHGEVVFTPRDKGTGSAHSDLHNAIVAGLRHALKMPQVPGNVWKFRRLQGTSHDHVDWHPCQLPPELLARIVQGWSNPGDVVLDGFAGSGSLAKVCKRLGRAFVGIDRSPTYQDEMLKELQ